MKNCFLFVLLIFSISLLGQPATSLRPVSRPENYQNTVKEKIKEWHEHLVFNTEINLKVFTKVIQGYDRYRQQGEISGNVLGIIDYTSSVHSDRFFIFSLPPGGEGMPTMLAVKRVAHGVNSTEGEINTDITSCMKASKFRTVQNSAGDYKIADVPTEFSQQGVMNSYQSVKGFIRTHGKGVSNCVGSHFKLWGLEEDNRAYTRHIYIHAARYMCNGAAGSSLGCLSMCGNDFEEVASHLGDRTLIYIHTNE